MATSVHRPPRDPRRKYVVTREKQTDKLANPGPRRAEGNSLGRNCEDRRPLYRWESFTHREGVKLLAQRLWGRSRDGCVNHAHLIAVGHSCLLAERSAAGFDCFEALAGLAGRLGDPRVSCRLVSLGDRYLRVDDSALFGACDRRSGAHVIYADKFTSVCAHSSLFRVCSPIGRTWNSLNRSGGTSRQRPFSTVHIKRCGVRHELPIRPFPARIPRAARLSSPPGVGGSLQRPGRRCGTDRPSAETLRSLVSDQRGLIGPAERLFPTAIVCRSRYVRDPDL